MINKAIKANHMPQRRCVICKNISNQDSMYKVVFINNQIIIDLKRRINSYGYYICGLEGCLEKLNKWKSKKKLKDFRV